MKAHICCCGNKLKKYFLELFFKLLASVFSCYTINTNLTETFFICLHVILIVAVVALD